MADPKNDTDFFWQSKYNSTFVAGTVTRMVDGSDALANHARQVISFQHTPSGQEVFFKAFITAFNESYNCDWGSEPIFGRTDPIYMFKGNQRQVSLTFNVPASSEGEAYENLGRVQKLIQFLYPAYKRMGGTLAASANQPYANTIAQSPLIKLKVMNLLASNNASTRGSQVKRQQMYDDYKGMPDAQFGELGAISSLQVDHNLTENGSLEKAPNTILPKNITVSVTFNVIHQKPIGWIEGGDYMPGAAGRPDGLAPSNPYAPYGVTLQSDEKNPDEDGKYFNERIAEAQADEENRIIAQAVIDNAKARYLSMGGNRRLKRDLKKYEKGKLDPYNKALVEAALSDPGISGNVSSEDAVDILGI